MAKKRERLLIVDNEPIHIDLLGELLRPEYDVLVATTGLKALDSASTLLPDLILLDVMMPGIDGHEVCRRLKDAPRTRNIPVIFLTAKDAVDDETRGFQLGAVDYITKPMSPPIVRARVRTQLELKRQRDELLELTELKNKFLSIAAHDLRSPLSSIILTLQFTLDQAGEQLASPLRGNLERANRALHQVVGLVEGLLDVKMIERGSFVMRLEKASLRDVLTDRIAILKPLTDRKRLAVISDLEDVPPFQLDRNRIAQTFDNLFTNAIKYSPIGSTIHVRLQGRNGSARVDVQDEGGGIQPEEVSRAFGEFQTLGSKPTDSESTTGLGLYIVKRIIEAHGGEVFLGSAPGQGTTISFSLPMR